MEFRYNQNKIPPRVKTQKGFYFECEELSFVLYTTENLSSVYSERKLYI